MATDLRLREWTDQSEPLLRKLAMEAPGTYHHSTLVSNMAEAAAAQIGANALLARVGGYLHDVGKISRPEYFGENAGGQASPHAKLSPMLSALILTAHTKDGVELAAHYGVPSPIRHIIAEHHGTCVVEYFHRKAIEEALRSGGVVRGRGLGGDVPLSRPETEQPGGGDRDARRRGESAARSMDSTTSSASGSDRLRTSSRAVEGRPARRVPDEHYGHPAGGEEPGAQPHRHRPSPDSISVLLNVI